MAMLPLGAALFFAWQPGEALPAAGSRLATLSTMVFAAIVLMQMANALECRSETASLRALGPWSNRLLLGAIAAEFLALVGFVSVPGVRHVLGQAALGVREWLPIAITPWILLAAEETSKAVVRRRPKSSS
jgi:magnesium-transporting ATPase (P-type)